MKYTFGVLVCIVLLLASCGEPALPTTEMVLASTNTPLAATAMLVPPTATPLPATSAPTPSATTPTYSGSEWPSARKLGPMVYDPVSERLFMFGGAEEFNDFHEIPEVWAYDPANRTWQEQGKLEPRQVDCAAVDEGSHRAIVFGGGVTWAYDPAADTWEQMHPDAAPRNSPWGSEMAYDAESDRIVLFGGGRSPLDTQDETWVYDYDTDTWTQMQPEVSPPQRRYHGMVYVPEADRVLLWGGTTELDVPDLRVWAYDYNTNTWTPHEIPSDAPEQRAGFGLFYHPPSGRMFVFGGTTELIEHMSAEITWAFDYDANSWEALAPSENPGKRSYFQLTYAPSVDQAVLFGGELTKTYADDVSDEVWIFHPSAEEWEIVARP
ncbi:MAG: kelch repeat-containing protein [Anaerolineae bacterium]